MKVRKSLAQRRCARALLITASLSGAAAIAQAPGTLDTGFGMGGRVTTSLGANNDRLHAVQILADERVVVAGESASGPNSSNNLTVARYLPNGLPDLTFGSSGITRIDGGAGTNDAAYALAVQTDRKILLAGRVTGIAYSDFCVTRLNESGVLDTGFGIGGIARINMAPSVTSNDYATAIAAQGSGKIVLGGAAFATDGAFQLIRFGLVRFDAGGTLDTTFGNAGSVIAPSPVTGGEDYLTDLARLPNGQLPADDRIVAVGYTAARNNAIVRRYTADGQPDPSFGSAGQVLISAAVSGGVYSGMSVIYAAVLQADGKLVIVGQGGDRGFAFMRLLGNGSPDPGFGTNGRAHVKFSGPSLYDEPFAVTVQGNGKIVAAGYYDGPPSEDFAIARLLPNGSPDPGFGDGAGRAIVSISSTTSDRALALALAPSGSLVMAGYVQDPLVANQQEDFALARVFGDPDRIFRDGFDGAN